MEEQRRDPRRTVSWPARLWLDEESIVGEVVDVSPYGLCVMTAPTDTLKRGRAYRVEIVADLDLEIACVGEVRHVSARGAGMSTDRMIVPPESGYPVSVHRGLPTS